MMDNDMAAVLVKYMGNMGTLTKSMVNFNKRWIRMKRG